MYLKNPSKHDARFRMIDPISKQQFTLRAKSFPDLTTAVIKQMEEFDRVTNGEYSKPAKKEAENLKLQYRAFINKLCQHQVCLNLADPMVYCYNDGYGDALHEVAGKIDDKIKSLPTPLKKIAETLVQAATFTVTGKPIKRLGGCSSCGGTKVYDPSQNRQLGRAGKINTL